MRLFQSLQFEEMRTSNKDNVLHEHDYLKEKKPKCDWKTNKYVFISSSSKFNIWEYGKIQFIIL